MRPTVSLGSRTVSQDSLTPGLGRCPSGAGKYASGPAPWTVPRPSETVSPAGRTVRPKRRTVGPMGRTVRPAGQTVCPGRRVIRPTGRTVGPTRRAVRPTGRTSRPAGRAPGLLGRTVRPVGRITRLPGRTARPAASESPTSVLAATSRLALHLIYALLKDASQPSAEMPYRPHRPC